MCKFLITQDDLEGHKVHTELTEQGAAIEMAKNLAVNLPDSTFRIYALIGEMAVETKAVWKAQIG